MRAVWVALAVLGVLRAWLVSVPTMWAWGLNVQRFLPPLAAWLPWLASAALLLPAAGRRFAPTCEALGDRIATGRRWPWLAAFAAALVVWSLPDRVWFTGDFMLRQGAAETGGFKGIHTQALPLEVLLNRTFPRLLTALAPFDPNLGGRLIGALAAATLAWAACGLARAWGLRGAAAVVAAATVLWGGTLTCFTGLGKPAAALCALTALAVLGATRLVSAGRSGALLGLAVGLALLVHRSALALLPLWLMALVAAWRAGRAREPGTRRAWALAAALPALAACVSLPRIATILRGFDLPRHLAPPEVQAHGPLAAAFAALHLADLANLVLFYTPAIVPAAAALAAGGWRGAGVPGWLPVVAAAPFVPLMLFVHPTQGVVRDLDVFAPAGAAIAVVCAHRLGTALGGRRLPAWLAPALVAAVAMPALQWLLHFHDPGRGAARARALALEAPVRPEDQRARLWDALAYRAFRERRWDLAVEASGYSARLGPHPRALTMWAIARTYSGDHRGAESLYVVLAARTPDDPLVWLGLGGAALRVGDSTQFARALARLQTYDPGGREARLIRRQLRVFPEVWPEAPADIAREPDPTRR